MSSKQPFSREEQELINKVVTAAQHFAGVLASIFHRARTSMEDRLRAVEEGRGVSGRYEQILQDHHSRLLRLEAMEARLAQAVQQPQSDPLNVAMRESQIAMEIVTEVSDKAVSLLRIA